MPYRSMRRANAIAALALAFACVSVPALAQHMTSHIFLALEMWEDVVRANEQANAVAERERG